MEYKVMYDNWLSNPNLNTEGLNELSKIKTNDKEIEYRFGAELEFGTAGMRGLIGYGTNMMNIYTVRRATKGLAEYLKSLGNNAMKRGVVISYDTRNKSEIFAKAAAGVLSANNINVYLFDDVRPVPMLSFAVRKLSAMAGIMITASHNPKEYNGYKVYGDDGAQMSPEATEEVVKYISEIKDFFTIKDEELMYNKGMVNQYVTVIGKSIDNKFYKALKKLTLSKTAVKKTGKNIKLVYTPIHGSGYIPVMTILKKIGIKATVVEEQKNKDINFSTVQVPNPEYKETLSMGIALANKIKADVVLGTDPDCDRLGVAIRDTNGEFVNLSGNQTGILLLDYILTRLKEENKLPTNGFVVKSFVTTGMAKAIVEDYGVELIETPVGFKFIGEKIKLYEKDNSKQFIFGFEESCGYLRGTHCRDKDAVVASMLFAEMVCYYTYKNISVYDRLLNIYDKYGYVLDKNVSIAYSGLNAMKEMNSVVDSLKNIKVEKFDIFNVVAIRDYFSGIRYISDGTQEQLDISKTNCIYYEIENGSFICVRPSGTEPKLKIYYSIKANDIKTAERSYVKLEKAFNNLLNK